MDLIPSHLKCLQHINKIYQTILQIINHKLYRICYFEMEGEQWNLKPFSLKYKGFYLVWKSIFTSRLNYIEMPYDENYIY